MEVFLFILIATFLISSGALIGIFTLALKKELFEKIILFLVAISAGTLMGGAFLHLIPEAAEKIPLVDLFPLVLLSFAVFYFIEKIIHWRHCHEEECEIHTFGYINLIGEGIHNFLDGLIIAATFLIDVKLGMATATAIVFHAIPQEVGNFGVLVYAGFKRIKALILNYVVALMMVIGGIVGYFLSFHVENLTTFLLPFAAGSFLYISTSDLIPEIRKEKDVKKSLFLFVFFLLGILILYFVK